MFNFDSNFQKYKFKYQSIKLPNTTTTFQKLIMVNIQQNWFISNTTDGIKNWEKNQYRGTWLTWSVKHVALDFGVVGLRPTLSAEVT